MMHSSSGTRTQPSEWWFLIGSRIFSSQIFFKAIPRTPRWFKPTKPKNEFFEAFKEMNLPNPLFETQEDIIPG